MKSFIKASILSTLLIVSGAVFADDTHDRGEVLRHLLAEGEKFVSHEGSRCQSQHDCAGEHNYKGDFLVDGPVLKAHSAPFLSDNARQTQEL